MSANNKFTRKMYELEVFSSIIDDLERRERDLHEVYTVVQKDDHQAKDWYTGELKWEDAEHTIPVMEDRWGMVEKPEEEFTEEDRMKSEVIKTIIAKIEKLGQV